MTKAKIIKVKCKHGHTLFDKYRKVKAGSLLKCYIDEIGVDCIGVSGLSNNTLVYCPACKQNGVELRVGRIGQVHGRPAVIVNHGGIKPVRTS
jgi:hypothetical protein